MTWPLFNNDSKLDLEGCYKRCYKCDTVRPVEDYDISRVKYGRSATRVSLGERCEQCRNPTVDDKQGELGI